MTVLNNLGVKLGALGVALLLWLHVVTEKTFTYTFQASLKPTHLAEDLIIANEIPDSFPVKIRGKGKRLLWLMFSDLIITLDLHDTIQSRSRFRLKLSDVVIPRDLDVTVMEIAEPDYVDVDIDRHVEKKVPVQPRLKVMATNGYVVLDSAISTPDSATIRGPRRFVEDIDTLYTEELTIQRAKRRVRQELRLSQPEGTNIMLQPMSVMAEMEVQKLKQRIIKDIPVLLLNSPTNKAIALDSSKITLTVEGAAALIQSLTPEDFHVSIDYRQALRETTSAITPTIETPPKVIWTEANPPTFKIIDPES